MDRVGLSMGQVKGRKVELDFIVSTVSLLSKSVTLGQCYLW